MPIESHIAGEEPPATSILRRLKANAPKDAPTRFIAVYLGVGLIISFLFLASVAPQLGEKLGTLSMQKKSQESQAAYKIPQGPCYPYGDVNFDRVVNVADANLVQKNMLTLTFDQQMRADVDANGKVTSADAKTIQQYHSGQLSTFPICLKIKASPTPIPSIRPSPYTTPYPTPIPSPTTSSYQLRPFPSYYIDLTDNTSSTNFPVSISKVIYALLYRNGEVVINQSDFEYSWKIMPTGTNLNLNITPFADCTNGIQQPCPTDHANVYGFATSPQVAYVNVSVKQKSNGATVAQNNFYLIVN